VGGGVAGRGVLGRSGLAGWVGDGVTEGQAYSELSATEAGGRGAARECGQYLVTARGAWGVAIRRFTGAVEGKA